MNINVSLAKRMYAVDLALEWSAVTSEPTWTYEIKRVTTNTSNSQLWEFALKAVRIRRGEYAINGTFYYNLEPTDYIEAEGFMYRSPQGNSYRRLPLGWPKTTLYEFMNTFYKTTLMSLWKNCSDLPQFTGSAPKPSFERRLYYMKKCGLPTENVPPIMMAGYYKMQFHVYGRVTSCVEVLVQLENKVF